MEEQVMKSQKRKKLIIALVAGILVLAAAAGTLLYFLLNPSDTEIGDEGTYLLYWNLDRDQYAGQAADGKTSREADADGFYNIRLSYRGRTVTRKTTDREIANEIDSYNILGLTMKDGIITDVLKVEDFTGGYACDGKRVYVSSVQKNTIVATVKKGSNSDGEYTLTMAEDAKVYDVSGETPPLGGISVLRAEDRFLAVVNKRGEVSDVFVIARADLGNIRYAYCEHCKQEVKWSGWEKITVLPAADSGHYFLMNDIVSKAQTSIQADTEIILDLNGKTIQGKEDTRVFSLHNQGAYLAIMDSSEEKSGKVVAGSSLLLIHQGACVWVRYGVFELYGGTLDASAAYSVNNGAAISVPKDSVFNMYGGTITGGTISTKYDPITQRISAGMGGNVYVAGTFNMYGGLITKGKAEAYYFRDTGSYTNGLGGNVFVAANGSFNMEGGELRGGTAHGGGGNVFVNAHGTFSMSGDSKITGGKTIRPGKNGGSIYIANKGIFNLSGGTIDGGATTNRGGNLVLYGVLNMTGGSITNGRKLDDEMNESLADFSNVFVVNGEMNMSGGYINGHVYLQNTATGNGTYNVNLSGTAQIKDAAEGYGNLYIRGGHPIHVGKLTDGAEIHITASGVFTTETAEANAKYFHLDYPDVGVVYYEKCLFAGRMGCLCGTTDGKHIGECDGKQIPWGAWSSKTSLPTTTGNYYLLYDIDLSGQMSVSNEATIALDLNGKTVKATKDGRVYSLHATETPVSLTITDSSKERTGKMIAYSTETKNEGLLFWLRRSTKPHTLTIYGGTFDASGVVNQRNGAAIHATEGTTINIHGGTIIGGATKSVWNEVTGGFAGGRGGTIYTTGTLNMTGGLIKGGKAVYTTQNVQVKGEDGKESVVTKSGDAYGGNIVLVGKNAVGNFTGGTIEGGSAVLGGNIYIGNTAKATLSGVTVQDGTAEKNGGNVYMGQQSRITMTAGQILGGQNTAEGANGGSIYICGNSKDGNAVFVIKGGLISGGKSMNMGGNFDVRGTLQVEGGEIKNGLSLGDKTDEVHSNIAVVNLATQTNNGQLIVTGGQIYGGVYSQTALGEVFSCITVSGTAKITAPEGYLGVTLRGDAYLTVGGKDVDGNALGGLEKGAELWVNQTVGKQVAATGTDTALSNEDAKFFKHETGYFTLREDGKLYLERTVEVSTSQELHDALQAGFSVILKNDITYDASKIIDEDATAEAPGIINARNRITLDMKGYTITYIPAADTNTEDEITAANKFINLMGTCELTITGNGKFLHKVVFSDADNAAMFRVAAGKLNIENGTFISEFDGIETIAQTRYLIWNSGSGIVNIADGKFSNAMGREIASAENVNIVGGLFRSNPFNYGLTKGYSTIQKATDDVVWWAVEKGVEVSNGQELHDALQAGQSVILADDIVYNAADITDPDANGEAASIININGCVYLNLNGKTINYIPAKTPSANKFFNITKGEYIFHVYGDGTIVQNLIYDDADNAAMFRVAVGKLTIEDGTYIRTFAEGITTEPSNMRRYIIWNGGANTKVEILDGTFINESTSEICTSQGTGVAISGGTFLSDPRSYGLLVEEGYRTEEVKVGDQTMYRVCPPVEVGNAQQLHDALQSGLSVILTDNIAYDCSAIIDAAATGESAGIIRISGNVVINLNGKTITYTPDGKADKFIYVPADTKLKIAGNGIINHMIVSATVENGTTVYVDGGELSVVNGTFARAYDQDITSEAVKRSIITSVDGVLTVKGGTFTNVSGDCVTVSGTQRGITGGKYNVKPAGGIVFGYAVAGPHEDGYYTVELSEQKQSVNVSNAQDLHDALFAGCDVTLMSDIKYVAAEIVDPLATTEAPSIIDVYGKVVLNLNGKTITYIPDNVNQANKFINLTTGSSLTINGDGGIVQKVLFADADNAAMFRVAVGELTIHGGTFTRVYEGISATQTNRFVIWNSGNTSVVNIHGGAFKNVGTREIFQTEGTRITGGSFATQISVGEGYYLSGPDADGMYHVEEGVAPPAYVTTAQSLKSALESGKNVVLSGNIIYDISENITCRLDASLDLNGYTITFANDKRIDVYSAAKLTVSGNGGIVQNNGTIFRVSDRGQLVINGGTFTASGNIVHAGGNDLDSVTITGGVFNGAVNSYQGTLTITGGSFDRRVTVPEGYYLSAPDANGMYHVKEGVEPVPEITTAQLLKDALEAGKNVVLAGNITYDFSENITCRLDASLDLNGYTITFANDKRIDVYSAAKLTVSGNGGIVQNNGTIFRVSDRGQLVINGGTFTASGNIVHAGGNDLDSVTITGGTFNGMVNSYQGTLTITGGSFDRRVTVPEGYYLSAPDANGMYHVKEGVEPVPEITTAQLLKDALEAGKNVVLAGNITYDLSENITCRLDASLDLNGFTITFANDKRIDVYSAAKLTVSGNGGIVQNNGMIFRVSDRGQLVINGGTFTASGNIVHAGGNDLDSVTITGGVFNGAVNSYQGVLTISGGIFKDAVNVQPATNCSVTGGLYTVQFTTSGIEIPDGYWLSGPDADRMFQVLPGSEPAGPFEASTAQQLHDLLQMGRDVVLTGNIEYIAADILDEGAGSEATSIIKIADTVQLDLAGYTITYVPNGAANKFFDLQANSELLITGNGTITQRIIFENAENAAMFRVAAGKLVIENGTFERVYSGITATTVNKWIIWNGGSGQVTIKGGTFRNDGARVIYAADGMSIAGGKFSSDPTAYGVNSDTYDVVMSTDGDGKTWYEVLPPVQASTAQQLKDALESGRSVVLAQDITYELDANITCRKDAKLDLGGYTLTFANNKRIDVYSTAKLTVSGNGSIVQNNGMIFRVSDRGQLVINGGTFTASGNIVYAGGNALDSVTISGGTFNGVVNSYQGSLTITGGTFHAAVNVDTIANGTISGGTFKNSPAAYLAEGYDVVFVENMYRVEAFKSVTTAQGLKEALEAGENVKLGDNLAVDAAVVMNGQSAVLDLNGKQLNIALSDEMQGAFITLNDSNLTIRDTSAEKNGKINAAYNNNCTAGISIIKVATADSALTVVSGEFTYAIDTGYTGMPAEKLNLIDSNGSVVIDGGKFINEAGGETVNGIAGAVSVNGGVFSKAPVSDGATVTGKSGYILMKPAGETLYSFVAIPEGYTVVNDAAGLKQAMTSGAKAWLVNDITFADNSTNADATGAFINLTGSVAPVVDLNGFKVVFNIDDARNVVQLNGAILTIEDNSTAKSGIVEAVYNGTAAYLFRVNGADTLILDDGITVRYVLADGVQTPTSGKRNLIHCNGSLQINAILENQIGGEVIYMWGEKNITLNGGRFNKQPAYLNTWSGSVLPQGVTLTEDNGWYVVSERQDKGVSTAAELKTYLEQGVSVYLTKDITISNTNYGVAIANKEVALDLNGNTITIQFDNTSETVHMFNLTGTTKLTVVDSSVQEKGEIVAQYICNTKVVGVFRVNSTAELTINAGNFTAEKAAEYTRAEGRIVYSNGTTTINGGTFTGFADDLNVTSDTVFCYNGTGYLYVNGGTFSHKPKISNGGTMVIKNGYEWTTSSPYKLQPISG